MMNNTVGIGTADSIKEGRMKDSFMKKNTPKGVAKGFFKNTSKDKKMGVLKTAVNKVKKAF